ncbi:MAG: aldehyde dehydrogenase family protein [Firmicutes bacterium]|nr:aldehyde dehydrogenase family protein [Bacillota bacterium]
MTETQTRTGLYINGAWRDGKRTLGVWHKYTGELLAELVEATPENIDEAVSAAQRAMAERPLTAYQRYEILKRTQELVAQHQEEIARLIAREGGKPLVDARAEVNRSQQTILIAAEEAKRIHGETVPLDAAPGSENKVGFYIRVPVGVVAAISPFNFPLNLVVHKVAPAIAAGCAVVLKPASYTPLTAMWLCDLLAEAGLPPGYINLVVGPGSTVGNQLVRHHGVDMVTFTGSPGVGEQIRREAGLKKVTLELGNNSANIVHRDADLATAARDLALKAFTSAGQFCVSVQRIYVHEDVYDTFAELMKANAQTTPVGNPEDQRTIVGPLIDIKEAERIEEWIHEATAGGATILAGGERQGNIVLPTVLVNTSRDMKVIRQEVFGPVVSLVPYRDFREAVDMVNDTDYGLQAGVYTKDIGTAWYAIQHIRAGSVHINDTSAYRADLMPYGGVKRSGLGREGPRYAVEEMTEIRMVSFKLA